MRNDILRSAHIVFGYQFCGNRDTIITFYIYII